MVFTGFLLDRKSGRVASIFIPLGRRYLHPKDFIGGEKYTLENLYLDFYQQQVEWENTRADYV